jgi:hypothetical protein
MTGGLVVHRFDDAARTSSSARSGHAAIEQIRLYELQDAAPKRLVWFDTAVYVPATDTVSWTSGVEDVERMSFELRRSLQSDFADLEVAQWLYVVHTDIPSDISSEYNTWYDEEHLPRLVKVPGIIRARRYASPDQSPRYLTAYELSDRHAFTTPEGLKARNTPWTARMRNLFQNTRRFTGLLLQTS